MPCLYEDMIIFISKERAINFLQLTSRMLSHIIRKSLPEELNCLRSQTEIVIGNDILFHIVMWNCSVIMMYFYRTHLSLNGILPISFIIGRGSAEVPFKDSQNFNKDKKKRIKRINIIRSGSNQFPVGTYKTDIQLSKRNVPVLPERFGTTLWKLNFFLAANF